MSDGLTAALAIIGAATGVTTAIAEGVRIYHERSRLRLRVDTQTLYGKPPRIVLDVLNDSPRATTIREVGLYAHPVQIEVGRDREVPDRKGVAEIDFHYNERPFFIEANETRQFAGVPDIFTYGIHADAPLRVYAIDARNRRIWGSAAPYVRLLVGENPPLDTEDKAIEHAFRPDGKTRRPWPVEPRWKLWKRRELRRSTKEARDAKAMQKAAGGTIRVRGGVKRFDPDEGPDPSGH